MEEKRNENQKPKRYRKKLFVFSKRNAKIAGAVYAALALCVVTVMVLSIYSVSDIEIPKIEDISISENSKSHLEIPQESVVSEEIPVENEQSGVPAETSGDEEAEKVLFVLPVKGETIKGYRMTSLVYSSTMKDYRTHSGIDIKGNIGDAVKCYSDGVISEIRDDAFMGKTIEVTHSYGLVSVYQNLMAELPAGLNVGAEVKAGDIIGAIGDTAIIEAADEAHLHFELLLDGNTIDAEKEISLLE